MVFEKAPSRARRIVRPGDVIVSTVRTYLRAIAEIGAPASNLIVSTGFAVIRPRQLESSFASYALRAPHFVERVVANSLGVSYPAINTSALTCFPIAYPDVHEQRLIAGFLDRETAKIDALVARKERLIELLQEKRTAFITRAVIQGLEPNVPMKESGVEWLGEIPAHWETHQGRYLYRALNLPPQKEDGVVTAYRDGQVTLRSKRRAEGYTFAIQEIGYQHVRTGDLVIQGMDAFAGAIGVSDSSGKCSPEYLVLEPIVRDTDNRYFAATLRLMAQRGYVLVVCNAVRERAPRFRAPEFRNVFLPRPPETEQQFISDAIDRETARIDSLISKVHKAVGHLKEFRSALISAAVTGKIDVREEAS